jgi:hypothetical protein
METILAIILMFTPFIIFGVIPCILFVKDIDKDDNYEYKQPKNIGDF